MLKLTYTENGFSLERLSASVEEWVTNRVLLALHSGTRLGIEPSTAAFLLPRDVPYLGELATSIEDENPPLVDLFPVDAETIEVSLQGTWITASEASNEGIFVCRLGDRVESFLSQVWKTAYFDAYVT